MGLLSFGQTNLPFSEIKKHADYIKEHGIIQFINTYNRLKDRNYDTLKWGDEIEYHMVHLDHEKKTCKLLLKSSDILPTLQEEENLNPGQTETAWRVEFTEYMVESSPGQPYGGCMRHFNRVEANMKLRREELKSMLDTQNETVLPITCFPRLGCGIFTEPPKNCHPDQNDVTKSLYIPDSLLNQSHPRYANLAGKPRERRGKRMSQNVPIFKDVNTPERFMDDFPNDDGEAAAYAQPNHVYMDCVTFGLGCSCIQVTFQGCNIEEARTLYDQLSVLAPIMLAVTAATPASKGYLLDTDNRWDIIARSCDDRTEEERGLEPLKNDKFVINKSRYDCVDMYMSPEGMKYNDVPVKYEQKHLDMLLAAGIDRQMAEHVAHFFIRDPISVFEENLIADDNSLEHFDNIQSTVWQTCRFKPPPPGTDMGWRVEFRPMEIQLTDFENAALVTFIVLITRVILSYNLNLLVPISKMEENMKTASKRDAVKEGMFYFRKDIESHFDENFNELGNDEYELMSVDTIINGKDGHFPGLVPLINGYMDHIDVDIDTRCTISQYLRLIQDRASGKLMTMAAWIRHEIRSHPKYKFDSAISEEILYDFACKADKVANGGIDCPELLGSPISKSSCFLPDKCKKMQAEVDAYKVTLTPR